jgi:hypothetical protein
MRPPRGVVRRILSEHPAEVMLPEDQHPVGQVTADRPHEALSDAVRPRATRRDLDHLDVRIHPHRVERLRELTGPIPDEEPDPGVAPADPHPVPQRMRPRPADRGAALSDASSSGPDSSSSGRCQGDLDVDDASPGSDRSG